jgi:hypothetical protein
MMKRFKERWEITANWQLLYPLVGLVLLGYSAFKIGSAMFKEQPLWMIIVVSAVLFFLGLKFTLYLFKRLSKKWILNARWEMIRVFLVFAITGSSSMYVGRPIINLLGITKENLNPAIYWILFIIFGLIFYQIFLVFFGWLFGQFEFFWNFEKKMLRRFGLKRFID